MLDKLKLITGGILLLLSFAVPLLAVWVAQLPLPVAVKTVVIGFMTFGAPELLVILAVALMGKPTFDWMSGKIFSVLGKLAPTGSVSRTRYKLGLILFVVSFLPSYVLSYCPSLLPEAPPLRIIACAAADVVFVSSLFVLGGDFWDKLRALFVYDAVAHFQPAEGASTRT